MTIYLFHGTGGTPDNFWFPDIKQHCAEKNLTICAPQFPNPDNADLNEWYDFFNTSYSLQDEDVIIAHSAGVPFTLKLLENSNQRIKKAILVAGFIDQLPHQDENHPTLLKQIDYQKIKRNCDKFYFIHSDNDPWGCDHNQGEKLRSHLGGTLCVLSNNGHFGSNYFNQEYTKFPLVKFFIDQ